MANDEGTFQMLWDCEYCDTAKLLALTHKHCPVCGAAQGADSRYFPKEGEEVAVQGHSYVGADKICPACDAPNGANAGFCGACGSDLEGAKEGKRRKEQRRSEGQTFDDDSAKAARTEHKETRIEQEQAEIKRMSGQAPSNGSANAEKSTKGGIVGLLVGVATIGGLFAVIIFMCVAFSWLMSKDVAVEAVGHEWSRSIVVEEYNTQTFSAWKDEVPGDGRLGSCKDEQRSTKKEKDGETCETVRTDQGDGTFKKSKECTPTFKEIPVMDLKCTYQKEAWGEVRTAKSNGTNKNDRAWPKTKLKKTGNCVGCQREGTRQEILKVHFKDTENGEKYSATCEKESDWLAVSVGNRYDAKGSLGSSVISCSSLKEAK